jgi:hypothetical protein
MSESKKRKIVQIRYTLMDPSDGLIKIKAENILSNQGSYPWATMPALYDDHLRRIIYRLDLLCECANVKGDAAYNRIIYKNLEYLDKVLDDMWGEVEKADKEGNMNADWRCGILDMWLLIEGRVGKHDPESVIDYIKINGSEDLKSDPIEIGMVLIGLNPSTLR